MAKKGGFSFDGMVNPEAASAEPIEGVTQRGAGEAAKLPQSRKPAAEPRKRGRPPKDRPEDAPRPSFALDRETHALFKIWLLRKGVSMQDYLEAHIRDLVKGER